MLSSTLEPAAYLTALLRSLQEDLPLGLLPLFSWCWVAILLLGGYCLTPRGYIVEPLPT